MAETNGFMRFFPYDSPYENQLEAMDRIANALTRGQDVLFEGACGTGKTLSALVPALEYGRTEDKTVVITTNVHQQMRQFVAEARAITRKEPIRAVVFRGKASMCHIDVGYEECQVLRDNTRELVEVEGDLAQLERRQRELLEQATAGSETAIEARGVVMEELESVEETLAVLREGRSCDHYYRNLTGSHDEFYAWLYDDVRTPDEIYEFAQERGSCGYELLKDGMDGVDLVVCNYHHLLNPTIRDQFFRWLGRDPTEVIAVFDEAHNIEDVAREHASRTLTENALDSALDELESTDDPRSNAAHNVLAAFRRALVRTYEDALRIGPDPQGSIGDVGRQNRTSVDERWQDVVIANDTGRDDLTIAFLNEYTGSGIELDLEEACALGDALEARYEEEYRSGTSAVRVDSQTQHAARFIEFWMQEGTSIGQYPVISVRRDRRTDEVYGRAELYTCIPRTVTGPLFEDLYASVLMSATLRPFDVLADVLGLDDPVTLTYGLQFPADNRRTFAVDAPALFASKRTDPSTQETIASIVGDAVRMTPGNSLIFFPSYREAERYYDRLSAMDIEVFLDEPGSSAESIRRAFTDADHAALFTSMWGTLTEGVSFDGTDASTVVVVGVPYPHLDDRLNAVQDAYDAVYGDRHRDAGWEYAVEIPTIRKTRQALGRVLRSPTDIGIRCLVDKRYTAASTAEMGKYSVRETFPPEERAELIDVRSEKVKFAILNFYADHEAYNGSPPLP